MHMSVCRQQTTLESNVFSNLHAALYLVLVLGLWHSLWQRLKGIRRCVCGLEKGKGERKHTCARVYEYFKSDVRKLCKGKDLIFNGKIICLQRGKRKKVNSFEINKFIKETKIKQQKS